MKCGSPLRWVGGKQSEAENLAALLPKHQCYVEPYLGGGSVLLAKEPSAQEIVNDIDGELVNFFRVLREQPDEFMAAWDWALTSREEFERLSPEPTGTAPPIERAYRFLYLNRVGFGGDMSRKPRWGGNPLRRSNLAIWLERYAEWVPALYRRLHGVTIEHRDACEVIQRYDSKQTTFFLDPPYRTTQGYKNAFTDADHRRLADVLHSVVGAWLMTVNDDPFIRDLYSDCHIEARKKLWGLSKTDGEAEQYPELLVANFSIASAEQRTLF